MVADKLRCVECGQIDKVQKVSGLRDRRLAAPVQPSKPGISWWIWAAGALLAGYGFIGLVGYSADDPSVTLCFLPGVVILLVAFVVYSIRKQRFDEQMSIWQKMFRKWDELYYCARCDGVFIPSKTLFIPSDVMLGFLRIGIELEKTADKEGCDKAARELRQQGFGLKVEAADIPWLMASNYASKYRNAAPD